MGDAGFSMFVYPSTFSQSFTEQIISNHLIAFNLSQRILPHKFQSIHNPRRVIRVNILNNNYIFSDIFSRCAISVYHGQHIWCIYISWLRLHHFCFIVAVQRGAVKTRSFFQNPHNRHSIACPGGRYMGCLL